MKTSSKKDTMQDPLHILEKIKAQEAPPFLYTRIEAKVQESFEKVPISWAISAFVGVILFIALSLSFAQIEGNESNSLADYRSNTTSITQNDLF